MICRDFCFFFFFGLCPSSSVLKNTAFRSLDLFPSLGEWVKDTYSVGSVTKGMRLPPPTPDNGNRSSVRNVVFFANTGRWTESKKLSNPKCYTSPSSEPFINRIMEWLHSLIWNIIPPLSLSNWGEARKTSVKTQDLHSGPPGGDELDRGVSRQLCDDKTVCEITPWLHGEISWSLLMPVT
jgi:hypothetical protein